MKKKIFILSLIFSGFVFSQEEAKTSLNIEGQVSFTTDWKGIFLNLGGPAIKFNFNKFSVALNFFPSLRFQEDKVKSFATPILGVGLQFYFLKDKRFILSFPSYYNTATNKWILTGGVGYLFTKMKK